MSWNTANDAVLAEGRRVLIEDPHRFDGVRVIGVDEHCWRQTRRGDKYVTVIIDLTPIRDGTGSARLLDMVEGRSKQVFKTWLGERDTSWRDGVEVVAMDGFTGFKTATSEELPDAVAVINPFHVVRLAGDALDQCRRRVQQATCGHRGRKGDPLYAPSNGEPWTCWPTSTGPAPPTGRPRRLTAASNISAAQPSASATSPTKSPDRFWRPAGSGPNYTLDHEEPVTARFGRAMHSILSIAPSETSWACAWSC